MYLLLFKSCVTIAFLMQLNFNLKRFLSKGIRLKTHFNNTRTTKACQNICGEKQKERQKHTHGVTNHGGRERWRERRIERERNNGKNGKNDRERKNNNMISYTKPN